jgi:L,D-transpeptidase YcbB
MLAYTLFWSCRAQLLQSTTWRPFEALHRVKMQTVLLATSNALYRNGQWLGTVSSTCCRRFSGVCCMNCAQGRRSVIAVASVLALSLSGEPSIAQSDWIKEAIGQSREHLPARAPRARELPLAAREVLISRAAIGNIDRALVRYERLAARSRWQSIPKGPALKPGDDGRRVGFLIRRLTATGDLSPRAAQRARNTLDGAVASALMGFQVRHGLTPSGRVNSYTRSALNASAEHRRDQLIQNRQRIVDLLAKTEGRRYVLVNIPAYELQAVNGASVEVFSRVVLGKPGTPTPIISAHIRALNTLPYWHVPQSIARRQLIPAIKKDPSYLSKQRIRVFASWGGEEIDPRSVNWWAPQGQRYVFRQDPGPQNALGLLRLDMPNKHIVYMHDTPLKQLYDYHLRPYSAGCVRVQTVFDVGEWLLRSDQNPARGQLSAIIRGRQKQTIKLRNPVDVHFVYISAWATADGRAHFRPDVYRKDARIVQTTAISGWQTRVRLVMP